MNKEILILIMMFTGMSIQSQTLRDIANEYLGLMPSKSFTQRIETDYRTLPFRMKSFDNKIVEIIVTISNDNIFYDSITKNKTNGKIRVGSLWTDFRFKYVDVVTKEFFSLENAITYYNQWYNPDIKAYSEIVIYKNPKRDNYIVGRFIYKEKNGILFPVGVPKKWTKFKPSERID